MRTTVTLDPDVEQLIRRRMGERGQSFKEALNDTVREGLRARRSEFSTPVHEMGQPGVVLDRALRLAGDLEDEELVRRERRGS
ncbi:MAG: antitoxin [Actinomycetota bacterium]|nr:antitoxin [Actinomycetota bacterium]